MHSVRKNCLVKKAFSEKTRSVKKICSVKKIVQCKNTFSGKIASNREFLSEKIVYVTIFIL